MLEDGTYAIVDYESEYKRTNKIKYTEQAFLSHIDGAAEMETIRRKFSTGEPLTDSDLMKLVILPLTVSGVEGKHQMLESVVTFAEQLPREQQDFVLSGVIVASDKFIKSDYKEQIRRMLSMTWLSEMYEKEKIEYGNQLIAQRNAEIAKSLLDEGAKISTIMKVTGLSEKEILELKEEPVTV